jgi:hypothetical protein
MVPQKLEIIMSLECCEGQKQVMASYYIGSWNIYDIKWRKDQYQSDTAASETEKDVFKQQTLEESKTNTIWHKLLWG